MSLIINVYPGLWEQLMKILWETLQRGVVLRAYPAAVMMANRDSVGVECRYCCPNNRLRGHPLVKRSASIITLVAAVVCCVQFSAPAVAAGWAFLEYSAVQKFNDEDWQLFSAAGERALKETPDGQTVEWDNPATSSKGQITPVSTFDKNGMQCRKVKIANSAGGFSEESVFDFCKNPQSGDWKVVP
jgi:surface antigen